MIRLPADLHNIPGVIAVIFLEGRPARDDDTRYIQGIQYELHCFGNAVADRALLREDPDHGVSGYQSSLFSLIQSCVIIISLRIRSFTPRSILPLKSRMISLLSVYDGSIRVFSYAPEYLTILTSLPR